MLLNAFRCIPGLLAVLVWAAPAAAETYDIDPAHTEVRFTWDHLGMSRQGGRFQDVSGKVAFDPARPEASTVSVTIPIKSISTGVRKLDELLVATKDYFDLYSNPEITFRSTTVTLTGDKTANVEGDLTMNGITRPAVLDVRWNFTGTHPLANINPIYTGKISSGFSATTQIRRSDWGITRGAPFVSDEIRITIETEMHRDAPPEAAEGDALDGVAGGGEAGAAQDAPETTDGASAADQAPGLPDPTADEPLEVPNR